MRVTLEFNGVQVRGAVALHEPLVWPVWFAVDGDAMRALLGDVTASPCVHAPGPQSGTAALVWDRNLVPSGLPESASGVGLALLYTEGGKSSATAIARYAAFAERVRQVALDAAAEASGLTSLLPFRSRISPRAPNIDELTRGIELDIPAPPEADDAPNDDAAAFAHVARLLAPLAPGYSAPPEVATPSAPPALVNTPIARSVIPGAPVLPGLVRVPGTTRPGTARPALDDGTVAASLVRFWPASTVAAPGMIDIRGAIPTRTALRDTVRASLTLSGRLRREE